jgi:hypothetical protein
MARSVLHPAQFLISFFAIALCFALIAPAWADDSDVVEVEEHWQLSVGGPDATRNAPQVTMIMSPVDNLSGTFFALTLNHWTYPDFGAGGYQLQKWHGPECVASKHGIKTAQLHHDGEVVTWVQRLTVHDGELKFQVTNGMGETWGSFGGWGFSLQTSTHLKKLNGYRPGISIDQSGIGFAGNRVSSLTLQKIRWKTANGKEHEMVAPIDIDSDLDP